MGEARQRKATDPTFGIRPKNGRGILLSAPVIFDGLKTVAVTSNIDSAELRRSALFWDRLVWPKSLIVGFESNYDEELLEAEDILFRPTPTRPDGSISRPSNGIGVSLTDCFHTVISGENARLFADEHVHEFCKLDKKEPGIWVMAQGDNSIVLKNDHFVKGRGQLVTLARAIPLPNSNFPIQELLNFREKRLPEIVGLNHELDIFYSHISKSQDPDFELNRLIGVIDRKCADMIKVSRESKWKFHLGSLSISLSLDNFKSAIATGGGWEAFLSTQYNLPFVGGVLGATVPFISFDRGLGMRRLQNRNSPFRVIASMHRELVQ